MPTSLADLEVSAVYGALDDDAFGAGEYVHAHVARELGRQARHEVLTGNYLVHECWRVDGTDDVEAEGGRVFNAPPGWRRVLGPFYPPRKRCLPTGELQVYARITSGTRVLMQIVTAGHARQIDIRSTTAPNVLAMAGTGSWEWYTLTGIRLGRELYDVIEAWVSADSASGFDTAAFGTPGSGTPTTVSGQQLTLATAAWNATAINAARDRNVIRFLNADGVVIVQDRGFVATGATSLFFDRPLTPEQIAACANAGVTFELRTQPAVRLGSFVLVEEDGY